MGTNDTMHGQSETGYQHLLHRHKRDLSWDDIEEFYDDKNNFAMYLVLPIIVIVYGGCAVIYCIARCRRYIRRKKKKAAKKQQAEIMESEPLDPDVDGGSAGPIAAISNQPNGGFMTRNGTSSSSEVFVGMDRDIGGDETPLPWQVTAPNDTQLYSSVTPSEVVPVAAKGTIKASRQPLPTNTYTNKGFDDDLRQTPQLPPPYNYEAPPPVPRSNPPPYNANNRKDSVEEIITLDPLPISLPMANNINSRKRRRPASRAASRQSSETEVPPSNVADDDEERDKARTIVRGDRPRRDPPVDRGNRRDRTPDIISHARTQPLEPRYRPQTDTQGDSTAMAKQAAQLLRLDHMGKQAGKKHKRLVFVAE